VSAILALLLPLAVPRLAPQAPTFPVGVEAVYVDLFVTADGRPVSGLSAADFELRDDGRCALFELVAVESLPLRTLLLLDTSGSVKGEKLEQLEAGAFTLLRGMRSGDEGALVTFDHEIAVRVPATTELARLEAGLGRLVAGGATALYDALCAGTLLAGGRGRSLLVAFSDGEDNLSWLDARKLGRVLEESNVLLQVIASLPQQPESRPGPGRGVTLEPLEPAHVRTLRRLAEVTGGQLWPAASPDRLAAAFSGVLEAMRTRYVLRFEPEQPRRPGLHEIDVRLVRRSGKVHCRRAYFVGPASR
jgi:VWFA-related protein